MRFLNSVLRLKEPNHEITEFGTMQSGRYGINSEKLQKSEQTAYVIWFIYIIINVKISTDLR